MEQREMLFKKKIVQAVQKYQRDTDVQQEKCNVPWVCAGNSKESVTVFNVGQYECI